MGVVSGIVMSYQFGTNWSVFSDRAGPIIGPLMAYEVLTAFFLEAGFLGVMLFGMNKVGKGLHFAATLMVAIGTFISAFWILSVNSWMQTPTGWAMNEAGQFVPGGQLARHHLQSELPLPPRPHRDRRLSHHRARRRRGRRLASAQGPRHARGADDVLDGDVDGWRWSRRCRSSSATSTASTRYEHQPVKIMAMEGHFQSHPDGAPLVSCSACRTRRRRPCVSRSRSRSSARCC